MATGMCHDVLRVACVLKEIQLPQVQRDESLRSMQVY